MTSVKKSLKQENDFGFIKKEPLDEDFKNEVNQLNQEHLNQDQLNKDKGGFQFVDLIITELKDHMTCYKFECSQWWKIYL